jgi:hypothetical protein
MTVMPETEPHRHVRGIEPDAAEELARIAALVAVRRADLDEATAKLHDTIAEVVNQGRGSGGLVAEIVGLTRQRVQQISAERRT